MHLAILTKAKARPQQTSGTWEYVDAHEGKLAGRLRGVLKRAAKEVVGKIGKRLKLEKGDLPGHEFHGNQWTGGIEARADKLVEGMSGGSKERTRDFLVQGFSSFSEPNLTEAQKGAIFAWKTGDSTRLKTQEMLDAVSAGKATKEVTVYRASRVSNEKVLEFTLSKKWAENTAEASDRKVIAVTLRPGDKALFVPYATAHHLAEVGVLLPPESMKGVQKASLSTLTKAKPAHSKEVQDILDQLDLDGISSIMVDELTDEMKNAFKAAGVRAYQQVGFKDTPEIVDHMDQAALDYAGMRGAELVGKRVLADGTVVDNPNAAWSITNTMRDDLRDLVSDAIVEGWSTGDLQDAIQDSFSFSDARAEMIARTELAYAHVAGNMEGWRQSGVVEKKRWIAADADPCPECEALDGEEVGLDEDFSVGEDGPPLHPNCRCSLVPVTASVEDIIEAYTGLAPEDYEEEKVDLSLLTKIHHPHKRRYGDKWQVVDDDGKVYGTHDTEEQANRQLAALYANKVDLSLLMKGDVPGHEFHGNQWTGGTGSSTDQEIRAGVSSVANQLGYPEEKITYSTEQQDFKVGGIDYVASGQANRDTGEITLFPNTILDRAEAEGIAAHEIGHCQFEAVKTSMGTAAFFDSMEKDWGQLVKDDGVSEYSRDWWDALSKGDANMMQCLHETFAEITRLDYEGKRDGKTLTEQGVKQSWRKLYMRMQKEYQKAKK